MPGFGRTPFGHSPFGKSDYGSDAVVKVFPLSYLEKDQKGYLKRYLYTIKNSFNIKRNEIDNMITLVSADKIRADLIKHLGAMIGIGLDENEPEEFQRTLVRDAVQYYRLKGTSTAYKIRGLISGFEVEVLKIWKIGEEYLHQIPEDHIYQYPPGSGDYGVWYTDYSPDMVSGASDIPINGKCNYCLTSYVKLNYTLRKLPSESVVGNLLDRVIQKVREVTPIHIRDLFVDLTITIVTDPLDLGVVSTAHETFVHLTPFADRYDIYSADDIIVDRHIPILNYAT